MPDFLTLFRAYFPVSGVETYIFIPPFVAFIISFFTSMAGITGAFLILPFQMSFLGFATPSVSSTNYLYNVVGSPGGMIRYIREKRMFWPLAWSIIAGTLPGVLAGYYVRVTYLPEPRGFKFFVGLVLLIVGSRLIISIRRNDRVYSAGTGDFVVKNVTVSITRIECDFMGRKISFSVPIMVFLSMIVGIIGGIYGIGGGAIIAPFCVAILGLPVYIVAGAAIMGTFVTSIAGILFYSTIPLYSGSTVPPDWILGFLFGIGGLLGMHLGARVQKHIPEKFIKLMLAIIVLIVAGRYIVQFIIR